LKQKRNEMKRYSYKIKKISRMIIRSKILKQIKKIIQSLLIKTKILLELQLKKMKTKIIIKQNNSLKELIHQK